MPYLSKRQAAEELGCSERTLERMVARGLLTQYNPPHGHGTKLIRFRLEDIHQMMEAGASDRWDDTQPANKTRRATKRTSGGRKCA